MKRLSPLVFGSILLTAFAAFSLGLFIAQEPDELGTASVQTVSLEKIGGVPKGARLRMRDLDPVWEALQTSYYDASKLDTEKLEWGAVKGFVSAIGDPYTAFMTPEEAKDFEDGLEGHMEGIGAELEVKNGKLVIVAPLKNSPAERAGIRAGDIILKVGTEFAEDMAFFEAIRKIRGKKGTQVTLTILREKKPEPFEVVITRSEIEVENLTLKKLDGDIFHLTLSQFSDRTKREFGDAIQKILLEKAKGLVLDLRGNGGGYLDISVDILSELLQGKKVAAIIKKRNPSENEQDKTSGSSRLADIPLVVLVDKGSASASEILAGAIQDYKRGLILGETTFGKGSVQELSQLPDGSNLRMTIAKWFTPLDRSIDGVGIAPDREVKMTEEDMEAGRDPQLAEAVKYLMLSQNRR